jgi:hypothetical protein
MIWEFLEWGIFEYFGVEVYSMLKTRGSIVNLDPL